MAGGGDGLLRLTFGFPVSSSLRIELTCLSLFDALVDDLAAGLAAFLPLPAWSMLLIARNSGLDTIFKGIGSAFGLVLLDTPAVLDTVVFAAVFLELVGVIDMRAAMELRANEEAGSLRAG